MQELNELMQEYREVQEFLRIKESEKDELRTKILTLIKVNDIEDYEDDNNKLEFTMNKRQTFDKNKAVQFIVDKGANPEEFFSETTYEMLKIKPKN